MNGRHVVLALTVLMGCQVNELGPSVSCRDCETAVEPGASVTFALEWFDEPCESSDRGLPGVRYCTPVEATREAECDGCTVSFDEIFTSEVEITPHRLGSLPVTLRVTRVDTGEVYEETSTLEVALADRLELVCIGDRDEPGAPGDGGGCRFQDRGGDRQLEFFLDAYLGDERAALDLTSVVATGDLDFYRIGAGRYRGSMTAPVEPTTITVMSASGATASLLVMP